MVGIVSKKSVTFVGQKLAAHIDEQLFSKYGFKVEQLMELAGLAAAQAIAAHYPKSKVAVLCGPGNNGGDGFVCARHLQQFGFTPHIVYPKESKNELMKSQVVQCETSDIPVASALPTDLNSFPLIVDALFGFSFRPPIREPFTQIIKTVRASGIHVFSIDIPSGWDVEKGAPEAETEGVITPHAIISLTLPKLCMQNWTGPHFLGGRFIPRQLAKDLELQMPIYPGYEQIVKLEMLAITTFLLVSASTVSAGDVVEIFGIARCPDTTKFVKNQLIPFYKDAGNFPEDFKIDFHAVPIGGSTVNGSFVNKCLHGPVECALNKLQMCAKEYIKKDALVTIGCIQGKKTYELGAKCISDDEIGKKIIACAESEEGEVILNDENSYRYSVAPTSAWLPWIQINGNRVQDAEFHLKNYICALESMKNEDQCKKN
ncbi:unnamed protein product [Caenorhabditis sp. 36 PRJEB53466]|nr:unnamed protein product [Caenorhabditis sp. 36 PRJEB53466]